MIAKSPKVSRKAPRVARRRNELDPSSPDINIRFALHLRGLLERKHWTASDLTERLKAAGLAIEIFGVNTWLRGEGMPKAKDLEIVGRVCGLSDYRKILPEPLAE